MHLELIVYALIGSYAGTLLAMWSFIFWAAPFVEKHPQE